MKLGIIPVIIWNYRKRKRLFFSLCELEKSSIAEAMVSFYNETGSKKGCFITVISIDKWYKSLA